jgi:hypothetical protein
MGRDIFMHKENTAMRLFTAIAWFFKILFKGNAAFAETPRVEGAVAEKPVFSASPAPAVQLLGLLQKEGRLVDFLQEDVSGYSDAEIGAAVRDIHRGCRETLQKYMTLRRVMEGTEGAPVTVPEGFDPSAIELQGNVAGKAPYTGTLVHGGWYVEELKLPTIPASADAKVAMPAQVEVR